MSVSCRFYKHRYPKQEDVVMVNVRSIAEMGAYVTLLEYNNIEGMIMLSELSRRRIRSINKLVRIGRNECVVVIRVDETKGRRGGYLCLFLISAHQDCIMHRCNLAMPDPSSYLYLHCLSKVLRWCVYSRTPVHHSSCRKIPLH